MLVDKKRSFRRWWVDCSGCNEEMEMRNTHCKTKQKIKFNWNSFLVLFLHGAYSAHYNIYIITINSYYCYYYITTAMTLTLLLWNYCICNYLHTHTHRTKNLKHAWITHIWLVNPPRWPRIAQPLTEPIELNWMTEILCVWWESHHILLTTK